jgi:formylglycine-generating enzyme required for sulfatase activity
LSDFYIAKYPVTITQFAAFVKASSYQTDADQQGFGWVWDGKDWKQTKDANWQHPLGPKSNMIGKDDHPVVQVSWKDALAFCQWLARETGQPFTLLSEAEWEKAARGTDGRIYPWGNMWDAARCNTDEGEVGGTTPVGKYSPQGDSPYGCADMAGNVWEWTRSLLGKDWQAPEFKYQYNPSDGRENLDAPDDDLRVLRGGSFFDDRRYARCASRYWDLPDGSSDLFGFRVGVVSLSLSDL